ncbi:DUF3459 domain-containing protein [bacterium]|nr:DUF3459 domain-containing protein [bacterium]
MRPHRPLRIALLLGATLVAITAAAPLRAEDVTFRVRMARQAAFGLFTPGVDAVDVAGSFNGWGTSPLTALAGPDAETAYAVTVGGFTAGETIEFKFRLNGLWDGTEEFPGVGNNRVLTVPAGGVAVDVWYNDLAPGGEPVDPAELSWWNDRVFYEIFVRSFQDSDGDGVGDFAGLTARLDELNDGDPATDTDLGITGIWLMPINTAASYHGYDAVDYRGVDPAYGTLADFEAFLAAAHARGIKVIMDFVMNHCSNQHPWFVQAAAGDPDYVDWFRWSAFDPGETGPWGQQVWHGTGWDWYYGLFWSGMPDLNYDTPAVKAEMFDTATFWLDTVGVDGFRLDAVLYIDEDPGQLQSTPGTLQFWHDYNAHVKSVAPDMLSVGEAWTSTGAVVPYVSDDRLDLCFEFDTAYAMLDAANGSWAPGLAAKVSQVVAAYPDLQFATFLTNHDQDRLRNALGFDEDRNRAAAALLLTLPGVPFLYYGEEIGMQGSGAHENIRSPMQWNEGPFAGFSSTTPWQALNADFPAHNVTNMRADPGSLWQWYRRLIALRHDAPALRRGSFAALAASDDAVLAFVRRDGAQTLLCLVNTADSARTGIELAGLAGSLTAGDHPAVDRLDPADAPTLTVTADLRLPGLALPAHGAKVYEILAPSGAPASAGPPRRLGRNHPNPFNPATTIRFELDADAAVRLTVLDLAGREVRRLVDGQRNAGDHAVRWDGRDGRGAEVASGTYLVRLEGPGWDETRRLVLVR